LLDKDVEVTWMFSIPKNRKRNLTSDNKQDQQ